MSDAEPSRCPDCGKHSFACFCPTYDPYVDDPCQEGFMNDPVNHPSHYKGKTFECIEIIEAYGLDHLRATALAYILRASRKNGEEDLRKAIWYLRRLAEKPLNLVNASYAIVLDPEVAREMSCDVIAEDFDIPAGSLRDALAWLIPDPIEFSGTVQIREAALAAAERIETYLANLTIANLPSSEPQS